MTDTPFPRSRMDEIRADLRPYRQPLLISLSVMAALAHDLLTGMPKSLTIWMLVGFPLMLCWFWGRFTGLRSWRSDLAATVLLILWACLMLFGALMVATRDEPVRMKLCRGYLSVLQHTPPVTGAKLDHDAIERMNAASGAASALKCWP